MIFKGTDRDAFHKASKGKTPKARRKLYNKFKAQNEKNREQESKLPAFLHLTSTRKISRQPVIVKPSTVRTIQCRQQSKYIEKKTILDDVRDIRSSKIVSTVSNSLATFIVRCGGEQWNNDIRNFVRSSIALAISEVTNHVLEKPMQMVDNIKLFIKIGKVIYKIIVWIDKTTSLWTTNDKFISKVKENNCEYLSYIRQYPRLAGTVSTTDAEMNSMKYKAGDIVLLNEGLAVRINIVNYDEKTYCAVSMGKDREEYTITDADIYVLVKHLVDR